MKSLSKRQKIVKNVAIVFFAVMLLLTFFSNTIMNYSLAEVSTTQVESASVSTKVRGTGTVEAGSTTDVTISETRKVAEVLVEEGDSVKAGDVILRLTEEQSEEAAAAKKELEALKEAYQYQILTGEIDASLITQAESGGIDYTVSAAKLESLSSAITTAQANVDSLQAQSDALEAGTAALSVAAANAQKELEKAQSALETAQSTLEEAQMALEAAQESEDPAELENAVSSADSAQAAVNSAQAAVNSAQAAVNSAQAAVNEKQTAADTAANALSAEETRVAQALAAAQDVLTEATTAHEEYLADLSTVKDLQSQYEEIQQLEEQYADVLAVSVITEITASVSGTISEINVKAGDQTTPDTALATIQNKSSGYTLRFSVTKQQAAKVKVGDSATIANSWYYGDTTATLKAIKTDSENPTQYKVLIFDIQGDAEVGQSMTLSVGEKSATYDYVVPNRAVREDNNGSFILIIKEKSSPLGNRYIATRVSVDVIVSDDSNTAISGALEGYEYVITTSSKLVNAGDYVRLSDSSEQ